ncbi:MAG: AMP-binding protein [Spongiibacteraceae bacterium]
MSATDLHTLTGLLRVCVAEQPEHIFLCCKERSISFREFDRRSDALALGLQKFGIQGGDTVATLLENSIDLVLLWFAANKLGAIWVPFNTALKGDFLSHQVNESLAKLIVVEAGYVERIVAIETSFSHLSTVIVGDLEDTPALTKLSAIAMEELLTTQGELDVARILPTDLAMLVFTSGTTGRSKACMVSHRYAVSNGEIATYNVNRTGEDVCWTCLPLFHLQAVGSVVAALLTQGTTVLSPRFSLSGFWQEIQHCRATIVNAMGIMIPLIAQSEDSPALKACYGQVRVVIGAPFDERLQNIYRNRFGVERAGANAYGMTEASVMTSLAYTDYAKPGTSGKRNDLFDVMIVDDFDMPVPQGAAGEVLCRPKKPSIMFSGYWKRPEETLEVFRNLWFHTGDIGRFDEDGYFHFVDRKKDYIRRSGENISSLELEAVFRQNAAVREIAAHAVTSELGEDEVKLTIVKQPNNTTSEAEICLWSIERLPYFAVPRYIEFRDAIPVNPMNKVLKHQLRAEGITAATWDRQQAGIVVAR